MKTARRTRRPVPAACLAAVAAAAALALSACEGSVGGDDGTAGSAPAGGASKDAGTKDAGTKDAGTSDSGSAGPGSADAGTGTRSGSGSGSGAPKADGSTCTTGKVSVKLRRTGGSAPAVLLKATNTGSTRCDLYGYPLVGFPDAQAPVAIGGGKPQSVVSLKPGGSAYASLSLAEGDGAEVHREKQLTVELADRELRGTGATARVDAPSGAGLALSDESTVSYWNATAEDAMR
ncbi:DUF4232 domain-containing protein [Streptomyces albus]|uniref:DUF4232 domain-containing protein n=1 Tax=Streptomyces albus TaxID=1888 RepID=UPI0024AD664D|nr:DUF4232 domain-containing protein [Streptomyces albus]MDI6407544.1 DUF4232 domain-containing protein [Streptomyces albus]